MLYDYPPGYEPLSVMSGRMALLSTTYTPTVTVDELEWEATGESCAPRVRRAFERVCRAHPDASLLFVSHGAPIAAMLTLDEAVEGRPRVAVASLSSMTCTGETFHARHIGVTQHLSDQRNLRSFM